MNKQEIEEMQQIIIDRDILDPDGWGETKINYESNEIAKCLFEEGYHKTIWHKVADGDLPEYNEYVLGIFAEHNTPTVCRLTKVERLNYQGDMWDMDYDEDEYHLLAEIVAWTEIPEYKE